MNVGTIKNHGITNMQIAHKKLTGENSTQKEETSPSAIQGDTVTISKEGRQKSESLRKQTDDSPLQETASSNTASEEKTQINVNDIKKDLQIKKSETKRKQKELENLQQQAENDLSKQTELHNLKSKVAQLKKEEEKIRSQIYSA